MRKAVSGGAPCFPSRMRRRPSVTVMMMMTMMMMRLSAESSGLSPPGKPELLGCRSPEKETFTCWWKPGSDGGLKTEHRFYYDREDLEGKLECPDYSSGGRDSCFFSKNHTSIWVDYSLTVVASNALGSVSSEPLEIDVMEIIKPDAPENVALQVEKNKDSPRLHVRWEHPSNTDPGSGWVSIKYQLRVQQEGSPEWNNYTLGDQTRFSLYSVSPGARYTVQVRCALDHGSWSDWSSRTSVTIPDYLQSDRPFWLLLSALSVVPLAASLWILVMKGKDVKQFLLPPVPGPKIRGVDVQLIQSGEPEDIIDALIFHEKYPPVVTWEDQMEEYLVVCDRDSLPLLDSSNSLKRKNFVPVSANFHSDVKDQSMESVHRTNDLKKVKDSFECPWEESFPSEEPPYLLTPKQQSLRMKRSSADRCSSATESTTQPLSPSGGYVDLQRRESSQESGVLQKYYSAVKEMNSDNVLVLHKENGLNSLDIGRQEDSIPEDYSRVKEVNSGNVVFLKTQNDLADLHCANEKAGTPQTTGASKAAPCIESICQGYVDAVPSPPLI